MKNIVLSKQTEIELISKYCLDVIEKLILIYSVQISGPNFNIFYYGPCFRTVTIKIYF